MSQSQALTTYISTVAGAIVVTFAVITALVVIWYIRKDDDTPIQTPAAPSPASVQRLAENAVKLLGNLNDVEGKIQQLSDYANQKVSARQKRTNRTDDQKT
ncbi:Uncharacterised protein [uncultured archaeon]|nr:Uncharacterised protein [uncultured archaeon]